MAAGPAVQPIVTPEAVVLDFERAGVASRAIALLVDVLALGAIVLAIVLIVVQGAGDDGGTARTVVTVVASLLTVVAWFCGFETLLRGRTPGKAAMGLRVVSLDGTPERFQQAFLRAAVGLVDFLLLPVGCIAVVSVLLSPRDQRLGDVAAGTIVVRERTVGDAHAPASFRPPYGWEQYAASLDVTALDDDAYGLIRQYLLRVPHLTAGARDHLAVRIANPVAVRIGHTPPPSVHPLAFLECVAARWQRLHVPEPHVAPAPSDPYGTARAAGGDHGGRNDGGGHGGGYGGPAGGGDGGYGGPGPSGRPW